MYHTMEEQHPIPRQITTFEFKLIGFMTLKQFLYLLVFTPMGFVAFKLFPIPIVNILVGIGVALIGVALAFLPINERPLDVWLKNLYKRLTSPTQYIFQKDNKPLYFLEDLYFLADPHRVVSHIESKEKLALYLQKAQPKKPVAVNKKVQIQSLLRQPTHQVRPGQAAVQPQQKVVYQKPPFVPQQSTVQIVQTQEPVVVHAQPPVAVQQPVQQSAPPTAQPQNQPVQTPVPAAVVPPVVKPVQQPFLTGVILNNKKIPLPGVLVYIKNDQQVPLRLLKTNPHGIFATYNPLPEGEYMFEMKDPNGGYFFDTMKIHIPNPENRPYEFHSKEMM
jgi:hypothetical protein